MQLLPVKEPQIEELLAGDHIRKEFVDTRINSEVLEDGLDGVIKEATRTAREVIEKHPVFVFGNTGVGKSTLTNALLSSLGDDSCPAGTDSMKPCTRGVDMFRCPMESRVGAGQLLLFDTEGWELDNVAPILRMCMQSVQKQGIPLEVAQNRLVLMLVVSGNPESQRHLDSPKFKSLVLNICREFQRLKLKDRVKPVFVPVVSHMDKVDVEQQADVRRNVATKLKEAVTEVVQFQDPILVSSKTKDNIGELKGKLREIFDQQLQSSDILMLVRHLIHKDLKQFLTSWHQRFGGLEAEPSLVRRHIWSVARSYGLRVSNIEAAIPACRWRDLEQAVQQLRQCRAQLLTPRTGGCFPSLCSGFTVGSANMQLTADDELHMDALRRHAAKASERDGQKAASGCVSARTPRTPRTRRTPRSPVPSAVPSAADLPPAPPPTSIDLTHLRTGCGPARGADGDASAGEDTDGGPSGATRTGTCTPASGSDTASPPPLRDSGR